MAWGPRCSKHSFRWWVSEMARAARGAALWTRQCRGRQCARRRCQRSAAAAPQRAVAGRRQLPARRPGRAARLAGSCPEEVRGKEQDRPLRLIRPAGAPTSGWGCLHCLSGAPPWPGPGSPRQCWRCCAARCWSWPLSCWPGLHAAGRLRARRRSFLTTAAVALMLAAAVAAHSAVASSQRHDGPLAEAAASGKSVVAILEITGSPRALTLPGQAGTPERWSVAARTEEVTVSGNVIRTRAELVVMGGRGWDNVVPGQLDPDRRQAEAARAWTDRKQPSWRRRWRRALLPQAMPVPVPCRTGPAGRSWPRS